MVIYQVVRNEFFIYLEQKVNKMSSLGKDTAESILQKLLQIKQSMIEFKKRGNWIFQLAEH